MDKIIFIRCWSLISTFYFFTDSSSNLTSSNETIDRQSKQSTVSDSQFWKKIIFQSTNILFSESSEPIHYRVMPGVYNWQQWFTLVAQANSRTCSSLMFSFVALYLAVSNHFCRVFEIYFLGKDIGINQYYIRPFHLFEFFICLVNIGATILFFSVEVALIVTTILITCKVKNYRYEF
jgi:hypothetical protein